MIHLKDVIAQGFAEVADYAAPALLFAIPDDDSAVPEAQASFRHLGEAGYWYITFKRTSGPTADDFSIRLGPGEPWTERNPPKGEVWGYQVGADERMHYYAGWAEDTA